MSDDPTTSTLADFLGLPQMGGTEFQIAWDKREAIYELLIQLGFTEDPCRLCTEEIDQRWFNLPTDDWVEEAAIVLFSTDTLCEFPAEPTATITLGFSDPKLAAERIASWLVEHKIHATVDISQDPLSGENDTSVWFVTFGEDTASFDLRLVPRSD